MSYSILVVNLVCSSVSSVNSVFLPLESELFKNAESINLASTRYS